MQIVKASLEAMLGNLIEAGNEFDPAALFIGVATAVTDNGVNTVLADITEGTGALATRVAVTPWTAPYQQADGSWVCDGPTAHFSPASSAEAQVIVGWFLATAAAAGTLKAFKMLPAPVSLPDEDAELAIVMRLVLSPAGTWDAVVSWHS